jgi:hypothetical protein
MNEIDCVYEVESEVLVSCLELGLIKLEIFIFRRPFVFQIEQIIAKIQTYPIGQKISESNDIRVCPRKQSRSFFNFSKRIDTEILIDTVLLLFSSIHFEKGGYPPKMRRPSNK